MEDGSTRYCKGCHALFTPRRRDQLYCSRACRERAKFKRMQDDSARHDRRLQLGRASRRRSGAGYAAEYVDGKRICPDCQRPYQPTPGTRLCPECSAWKAELARIGRKTSVAIEVRRCPVCGELFVVRASSSRRTCGRPECELAAERVRTRTSGAHAHLYNEAGTHKKCVDCGEWYEPYVGCALRCRLCAAQQAKEYKNARKRQKEYGERGGSPVLYSYIMKRDGWRCYLCGGRIDPRLSYPHQMSGSLDHVIPFSLGGTYTRENIRAAHLDCNRKKHTKAMNEQIMLVG